MASHLEFFGFEQLRYGYFWPYPNMLKAEHSSFASSMQGEVPRQSSLEDVEREMDGRDTLKDIPVFAMRVQDSQDSENESIPIIADRIIMLDIDPMGDDHTLLAEIDSGW